MKRVVHLHSRSCPRGVVSTHGVSARSPRVEPNLASPFEPANPPDAPHSPLNYTFNA